MEWLTVITIGCLYVIAKITNKKTSVQIGISFGFLFLLCLNLAYGRGISKLVGIAAESANEDGVPVTAEFITEFTGSNAQDFKHYVLKVQGSTLFSAGGTRTSKVSSDTGSTWTGGPSDTLSGFDDIFITSTGTWLRADGFSTTTVTIDRSTNSGSSWTDNVLSETVVAVTLSFSQGQLRVSHFTEDLIQSRLWFSYNSKIAYSDDDGASWITVSGVTVCTGGSGIVARTGKIVVGDLEEGGGCADGIGTSAKPVVSVNNGDSWTVVSVCSGCPITPKRWYNPIIIRGRFYMLASGGIGNTNHHFPVDGGIIPGATWTTLPELGSTSAFVRPLATYGGYETNKNGYIYAAAHDGAGSDNMELYYSKIPVSSWTKITGTIEADLRATSGCDSSATFEGASHLLAIGTNMYFYVWGEHGGTECDTWFKIRP